MSDDILYRADGVVRLTTVNRAAKINSLDLAADNDPVEAFKASVDIRRTDTNDTLLSAQIERKTFDDPFKQRFAQVAVGGEPGIPAALDQRRVG